MDSPGVYENFLRLVKKAREKKWRPVKVFTKHIYGQHVYVHVCLNTLALYSCV